MKSARFLADRAVVLLLGVAVGSAIGYAFGSSGKSGEVPVPSSTQSAASLDNQNSTTSQAEPDQPIVANSETAAENSTIPKNASGEAYKPFVPSHSTLPPEPSSANLNQRLAQGEPLRVGVFGDSYGDGLWSALYRLLPAKEGYRVLKFSQQSTGFTRYQSQNVEEKAKADLVSQPVDIAVICFGANDVQGVLVGHHAAPLLSAEWRQVIGDRIESFVTMLRQKGISVYWIGLPVMRKSDFDASISSMNSFYTAEMAKLNVPFIETRSLTMDENGQYSPYLMDGANEASKKMTLMRANDGVHMSMIGYVRLSRGLASQIRHFADQHRPKEHEQPTSNETAPAVTREKEVNR